MLEQGLRLVYLYHCKIYNPCILGNHFWCWATISLSTSCITSYSLLCFVFNVSHALYHNISSKLVYNILQLLRNNPHKIICIFHFKYIRWCGLTFILNFLLFHIFYCQSFEGAMLVYIVTEFVKVNFSFSLKNL